MGSTGLLIVRRPYPRSGIKPEPLLILIEDSRIRSIDGRLDGIESDFLIATNLNSIPPSLLDAMSTIC